MKWKRGASSSAAALTRGGVLTGDEITPPLWPAGLAAVTLLAGLTGLFAAALDAPVGNRVALRVEPASPDPATQAAAHAVHAELITQLRAMRLDVGGPPDGLPPAVTVHARVSSRADDAVAYAQRVVTDLSVEVTDDDAGGTAQAGWLGFDVDTENAAINAGRVSAWLAAGKVAALVAPDRGDDVTLRRITDGRGSLRVFARSRGDLVRHRQERLAALLRARTSEEERSNTLSRAQDHTRLVGELYGAAVLVWERREPLLLPMARHSPRVLGGLEHLVVRAGLARGIDDDQPLMTAAHFFDGGAVGALHVAVAVRDGDDTVALCRVDALTRTRDCLPVGAVADAQVLAMSHDGSHVLARVKDCLSGCRDRLVWWQPDDGKTWRAAPGPVLSARLVDGVAELRVGGPEGERTWRWLGHQPPEVVRDDGRVSARVELSHRLGVDVRWLQPLGSHEVVALVAAGGSTLHWRLAHVDTATGRMQLLTRSVGDERNPVLSRDGTEVFFEVEHPDPDADALFTEVRRLALTRLTDPR
ncbi:MAG: hypothetical protein AB2A00_35700 [Myxococcota bacterium]